MAYENGFLAGRGEFRPVRGDGGVEVEQPPVREDVGAERGRALAGGPDVDQGFPLPGAGPGLVGPAAPEVGHGFPVDQDRDGRAEFVPLPEIRFECGAYT